MNKAAEPLKLLHRAILLYMAVFTVPALLSVLLPQLPLGAARALSGATRAGNWLMALWFLSAAYFCACLVLSSAFRETLLARIAGFRERDEREELVTAKAARSVFLVTLGCLIAAGLAGLVRVNVFSYTHWAGGTVPPLEDVGPHRLRRGEVARRGFMMWPSIGVPDGARRPVAQEREEGGAQYYFESGSLFGPEVPRFFFALAAVQVLLFHLFSRRERAS